MKTIGPDVSFYQNDKSTLRGIDFQAMKAGGASFVIIRAGQNKWADRDVQENWKAARGILPRGSYWFYDSRVEPKAQAELWIKTLGGDLGELPLWCDFEDTYKGAYHGWRHWYNFITCLEGLAPGKEIGIYTGYYYWKENTLGVGIPISSLAYFKRFPLWIANYGTNDPLVPLPWETWILWQFTDNGDGVRYGVESKNIDLNYFNGSTEDLKKRFSLSSETPDDAAPQPAEMPTIERMTLELRSQQTIHFKVQE